MVSLAAALLILSAGPVAGASLPPDPPGWTTEVLPQGGSYQALAVGVAAGSDSLVAVGKMVCKLGSNEISRCWGQPWTSRDGMAWSAVDARVAGLDLGYNRPMTSGPELGLAGVAYGPGGFVAFGRAQATPKGQQQSAIWRSPDGSAWERVPTADLFPRSTRLRTILGTTDGYLLGGVLYGERAPHAAIWSSPDGLTWTRANGRDRAFEIGGYIDTLEDPASGGINAFAVYPTPTDGTGSLAGGAVAVGEACVGAIDRSIWAFNGNCWGQLWRSLDGLSWQKGDMPQTLGAVSTVATRGERAAVGAPICPDCPAAVLVSDDASTWRVAYGSPVEGRLEALTSVAGRFYALLVGTDPVDGKGESLAVWSSDDGTEWRLDDEQPTVPFEAASFHDIDMIPAGNRLLIVAGAETSRAPGFASVAMIGPVLP